MDKYVNLLQLCNVVTEQQRQQQPLNQFLENDAYLQIYKQVYSNIIELNNQEQQLIFRNFIQSNTNIQHVQKQIESVKYLMINKELLKISDDLNQDQSKQNSLLLKYKTRVDDYLMQMNTILAKQVANQKSVQTKLKLIILNKYRVQMQKVRQFLYKIQKFISYQTLCIKYLNGNQYQKSIEQLELYLQSESANQHTNSFITIDEFKQQEQLVKFLFQKIIFERNKEILLNYYTYTTNENKISCKLIDLLVNNMCQDIIEKILINYLQNLIQLNLFNQFISNILTIQCLIMQNNNLKKIFFFSTNEQLTPILQEASALSYTCFNLYIFNNSQIDENSVSQKIQKFFNLQQILIMFKYFKKKNILQLLCTNMKVNNSNYNNEKNIFLSNLSKLFNVKLANCFNEITYKNECGSIIDRFEFKNMDIIKQLQKQMNSPKNYQFIEQLCKTEAQIKDINTIQFSVLIQQCIAVMDQINDTQFEFNLVKQIEIFLIKQCFYLYFEEDQNNDDECLKIILSFNENNDQNSLDSFVQTLNQITNYAKQKIEIDCSKFTQSINKLQKNKQRLCLIYQSIEQMQQCIKNTNIQCILFCFQCWMDDLNENITDILLQKIFESNDAQNVNYFQIQSIFQQIEQLESNQWVEQIIDIFLLKMILKIKVENFEKILKLLQQSKLHQSHTNIQNILQLYTIYYQDKTKFLGMLQTAIDNSKYQQEIEYFKILNFIEQQTIIN